MIRKYRYKPLNQPSQNVRGPEFSGKLNPLEHHCQALDLLIIEVRDSQNIYSSKVIYHIVTEYLESIETRFKKLPTGSVRFDKNSCFDILLFFRVRNFYYF